MTDLFVFRLTQPEGDLIGKALGRLPFDEVYALIAKLQRQAQFEQEPPTPPPAPPPASAPPLAPDVKYYADEPSLPTPDVGGPMYPTRAALDEKTAEWERRMVHDHIKPIGVINGKEVERQPLREGEDAHEGSWREKVENEIRQGKNEPHRQDGEG